MQEPDLQNQWANLYFMYTSHGIGSAVIKSVIYTSTPEDNSQTYITQKHMS